MDVRAPALVHTRGYGLAVTLYHGEGEGMDFRARRSGAGSTCGRGRYRLGRNAVSFFILTLTNENSRNTSPVGRYAVIRITTEL